MDSQKDEQKKEVIELAEALRDSTTSEELAQLSKSILDVDTAINLTFTITHESAPLLTDEVRQFYRRSLEILNQAGILYAVGAAFARNAYTGIWRNTKDLDVFLRPQDLRKALDAFEKAGFATKIASRHWLAKAFNGENFVDLIFGTGHGNLPIDDSSFEHRQETELFGVQTFLYPIEEMIASASYVAERGRFDGAEIAHLIHGAQGKLDWERLLNRLGDNRQLLLWHLILFDFVYPGHAGYIPQDLVRQLFQEMQARWKDTPGEDKSFRGSLLDPFSFTVDTEDWGYEDRRKLEPIVNYQGDLL